MRAARLDARHVTFVVAEVLLVLLAGWWCVLLARSVHAEARLQRQRVELEARLLSRDPDPAALEAQAAELGRRRAMVVGEGALMLGLVGVSVGMLSRLFVAERRQRQATEAVLARLSHEMKTPLAGIQALLQTLRDGRVPDERVPELVSLGLRQAEREERLLTALADAGRQSDARAAALVRCDAAALARDVLAERAAESALLRDALPEALPVSADPQLLRAVLRELIGNAVKYGARTVSVSEGAARGGRAAIVVSDDGDGFAPDAAASLFAPFWRAEPGRRHGSGLGLSIARAQARRMGGDLEAASGGVGRGAAFTLTLRREPRALRSGER